MNNEEYQKYQQLMTINAKNNLSDFAEYVFGFDNGKHHNEWYNILMNKLRTPKDGDLDSPLEPAPKGWVNHRINLMAPRNHAKALSLDTKVYTEYGATTIKDVQVGQKIVGDDGQLTVVLNKSEIFHKKCYEIEFSNGEKITASEDHLWTVITKSRSSYYRTPKTITTAELQTGMMLPHIEPVKAFSTKQFEIDPYVLGVWLGDGHSDSGRITNPDDYIVEKVGAYRNRTRLLARVPELTTKLNKNNLLKNKHIPEEYQYGDYEQRRQLICGLMDTDGTVKADGTYQFDNTNLKIIKGLQRLLRSFGISSTIRESKGSYKRNNKVIECKTTYRLNFQSDIDLFSLPRKLNKHKKGTSKKRYIYIKNIKEVETVPTQCLMVDNQSKLFLCGDTYLPTHNSTCFTVVNSLWLIGNNPNIRILIVSASAMQAQGFLREIKDKILKSPKYRQVFGDLFPEEANSPGEKWTSSEIIVRRSASHKDPTVTALGSGGPILSKRADVIICDDILSVENTRTSAQREKIKQWYNEVLLPVLEPDGVVINIGTAWNLEDLLHEQVKNPRADVRKRYKAILPNGESLWPERWPIEKLQELKEETGSIAFSKSYLNEAISSEDAVFKSSWIDEAKKKGRDRKLLYNLEGQDQQKMTVAMGVDLAISQKETGDYTAFAVVGEMEDGTKIPLYLAQEKLTFAQTQEMIKDLYQRFNPALIKVESNAYQAALVRDMQDNTSLPIKGYSTGGEKFDPDVGLQSIAVEMENGKWILPYSQESHSTMKIVDTLTDGMLRFPSGHTEDILMALWFANTGLRELSFNQEPRKVWW